MTEKHEDQIAELRQIHKGLNEVTANESETLISGSLPFEASSDGLDTITDSFHVELSIPNGYPDMLPLVKETGGRIERTYAHINNDGALCLAVPTEQRRIFFEQPTLLGFVNRLVIPYFYGYCYWKQYNQHPFDEQVHGEEGIAEYYVDTLKLTDEIAALAVVCFLCEHGYRGHHPCPCGSGLKVRKCHGQMLRNLHELHTTQTLRHDFVSILYVCLKKFESGQQTFPVSLQRKIERILKSA